jgi:hypothetical protein
MNLLTVYNDRLKGLHLEIINGTYNTTDKKFWN